MSSSGSNVADEANDVGYQRPPKSTRFQKGQSGNPRGRPPNRHRGVPYETVLGQMVTIREDGRERRVTAAEAFLLQLTRKGLQGDSAAARASLAAIEAARALREPDDDPITVIRLVLRGFGVGPVLQTLGLAVKTNPLDNERVRCWLKPWIVEAALARLAPRQLSKEDQREVWSATLRPNKVRWPEWWTERRPRNVGTQLVDNGPTPRREARSQCGRKPRRRLCAMSRHWPRARERTSR